MKAGARIPIVHGRHYASWLAAAAVLCGAADAQAQQTRVLGIDVSAWQTDITEFEWATFKRPTNQQVGGVFGDGRDFVFIRASRGGTTGVHPSGGPGGGGAPSTLSQRYDDPYFIRNITWATKAGLFAGSYHFSRPDVIESTPNSNGIRNTGTDEANHFLQMAGPWMRPGYLPPTHDLEAGINERNGAELAQFAIDFSNRIYEVKGIRPAIYIGGNYTNDIANEASPALKNELAAAYPTLWNARWPNQGNPGAIDVQNGHPKDTYGGFYGPWNNPNTTHPWSFWQYASTARLNGNNLMGSNTDVNVAQGGMEFLKDKLIPALWLTDASGSWGDMAQWNSGVEETEPVTGAGQVARVGPAWTTPAPNDLEARPIPRLPGTDAAAIQGVYGANDTVILDRGAANPTITLSSGNYTIRRLQAREALNITGGSLTVAHAPSWDSPAASARISAPVSVSGGASFSVHTLDVDSGRALTVGDASFQFSQVNLAGGGTPGKIIVNGDVNIGSFGATTGTIANSGQVDLAGGNRNFNVANGPAAVDVAINAPIVNGGLTKSGPGTLALGGTNTYVGDTTVLDGTLSLKSATTLADSSSLFFTTGAMLNLDFTGGDAIDKFYLDGDQLAPGTWGALTSAADHRRSWITGGGMLSVAGPPIPPPPPGPGNVLDNFDVDEGHFGWLYNSSPISQTFGLTAATAIDRVTTEAQAGVGSQKLDLRAQSGGAWALRHNSGIGQVANPAGNVPLEPTGYVGFWLKTESSGVTVQIAIDDPTTTSGTGSTALEKGIPLEVIADGQWHLYQWNLEDAAHWNAFAGGANGQIDATFGTVSIDSIFFSGTGNTLIYLDTVSHNPDAMLAAAPPLIPGDFNGDGDVDGDDLADWSEGFGMTSGAEIEDGDADEDGDVDGNDFLVWQRNVSNGSPGAAPVPEPAAGVLAALAATVGLLLTRRRK